MQSVRDFLVQCTLPSKYGKTHADWLKDSRIKLHTLTSFSGIILTVMPILFLYMQSFCSDDSRLTKHMELVTLAHYVCGILATGSDMPMKYIGTLRELVRNLHKQFVELYDTIKPKLHHLHHVLDTMEWVGKSLSCFVTERKHRTVKDIALYVFRNMEHTIVIDIVNHHCEQLLSGPRRTSRVQAPTSSLRLGQCCIVGLCGKMIYCFSMTWHVLERLASTWYRRYTLSKLLSCQSLVTIYISDSRMVQLVFSKSVDS